MSHRFCSDFETVFSAFESDKFCVVARLGSLGYFFKVHLTVQGKLNLQIRNILKHENVAWGGGGKEQKMCQVSFECPHNTIP